MKKRMNFEDLADYAEKILMGLENGTIKVPDAKEKINAVGKMTNIYKGKLEYNINRSKIESVEYFEEK